MTLSKAFAQAQTDEWVVIGLTRSDSQRLTELTTGGEYVDGSLLHIVLANDRKAVTMPNTRQLLGSAPCVPTELRGYGDHRGWWDKCFEELLTYKANIATAMHRIDELRIARWPIG